MTSLNYISCYTKKNKKKKEGKKDEVYVLMCTYVYAAFILILWYQNLKIFCYNQPLCMIAYTIEWCMHILVSFWTCVSFQVLTANTTAYHVVSGGGSFRFRRRTTSETYEKATGIGSRSPRPPYDLWDLRLFLSGSQKYATFHFSAL